MKIISFECVNRLNEITLGSETKVSVFVIFSNLDRTYLNSMFMILSPITLLEAI